MLEPVTLEILLYVLSVGFGCTNWKKWRGFRMVIVGSILLTLTSVVTGIHMLDIAAAPAIFLIVLGILPYAWARGHAEQKNDKDISKLKGQFIAGTAGACVFLLLEALARDFLILIMAFMMASAFLTVVFAITYIFYFRIYGNIFQEGDMIPVLLTDNAETKGFLLGQIGIKTIINGVMILIAAMIGFLVLLYLSAGNVPYVPVSYKTAGAIVLSLIFWFKYTSQRFPRREYALAKKSIAEMKNARNIHKKNLEIFRADVPDKPAGNVILIIGESANRDHMKAFNPDYPVDTTPWETAMTKEPGFYFIKNAYSNFTQTAQVLKLMLTGMNQYDHKDWNSLVTIFDVAKAAGMKTWWLSNQGANDYLTEYIAETTDCTIFTDKPQGDDGQLLTLLKSIKGNNNFIVIHMMGSHLRYEDRVPDDFQRVKVKDHGNQVNAYDTSIAYTDNILKEICNYAREKLDASAVVYVSDHSEDMKYTHGTGHFTYDMTRIPMWVYLSEKYRKTNPQITEALEANKDKCFTNDLIYDMMSHLLGVNNSIYSKEYDIIDNSYALTWEKARTMHGGKKISEDNSCGKEE